MEERGVPQEGRLHPAQPLHGGPVPPGGLQVLWSLHFVASKIQTCPWELSGEESACNVGDLGSTPGLGRSPGEGNGNPLQYSYLKNPHGQRSLAGYSPWGHKESDMTEVT